MRSVLVAGSTPPTFLRARFMHVRADLCIVGTARDTRPDVFCQAWSAGLCGQAKWAFRIHELRIERWWDEAAWHEIFYQLDWFCEGERKGISFGEILLKILIHFIEILCCASRKWVVWNFIQNSCARSSLPLLASGGSSYSLVHWWIRRECNMLQLSSAINRDFYFTFSIN